MQTSSNITQDITEEAIKENSSESVAGNLVEIVEGTPLAIVESEEGYFVAIGSKRITEFYRNKEELKATMGTIEFTCRMIVYMVNFFTENKIKKD